MVHSWPVTDKARCGFGFKKHFNFFDAWKEVHGCNKLGEGEAPRRGELGVPQETNHSVCFMNQSLHNNLWDKGRSSKLEDTPDDAAPVVACFHRSA